KTRPRSLNVNDLLAKLIADARGDDAQLAALTRGIDAALELPVDIHVVGEPRCLFAVEYAGSPRRGIVARWGLADGAEYVASFADVEFPADSPGDNYVAAYRAWLGAEPATRSSGNA